MPENLKPHTSESEGEYTRAELLAMRDPQLRQRLADAQAGKIPFSSPKDLP